MHAQGGAVAANVMWTVGSIMRLLVALLGVPFPPRHAIAASSAREGEKVSNVALWKRICGQSLENLVVEAFLVVDHDSDLKNRCSPSRFREIAIDNLSLHGGSNKHAGGQNLL